MASRWRENGIVVTALAFAAAALLAIAESLVDDRTQSPIVIAIDGAAEDDDEGEDQSFDSRAQDAALASTVPLYGSLDELDERARQALAEPQPRADLLHELARQARGFRAYTLAEALLARCLELAPQRVDSQFLLARTRSDLGRVDQAIDLYEAVLVLSPNHQKATYNLGVLSRRAGELLRAETLLKRAAAISSGRLKAKALHQLGLTYGAAGRWEDAARSLEEAVSLRPDSARHWLDLGQAHQQLGRLEDAQLAYEKALALNRRLADAHVAMGSLLETRGDHVNASAHFIRAVKLDSDNPHYRKMLARHALVKGDDATARGEFRWLAQNAASEADRAYSEAMLALLNRDFTRVPLLLRRADELSPGAFDDIVEQAASALHEQGQDEGAGALLDTLLARASPSADVLLGAARTALRLERWTDAETLLRRGLKLQPASSETWFQLGRALSGRGDLQGAIAAYESSLTHNPNARNTRLNLAVLYARNGDESAALQLYDELLRAHPRYTPALLNRALVHERAGRASAAIADLELALRVAGDGADIRARLARLLLREGQNDRAQALLSDAVAESPSDPELRLLLAEAELHAGRRGSAVKELSRAAALAGEDGHLWSRLAQNYREAGDVDAAARADLQATRASTVPPAGSEANESRDVEGTQ